MIWVRTAFAFAVAAFVAVFMAVFFVISFAGPHSAPLSPFGEALVYSTAGLAVVAIPVFAAVATWRSQRKAISEPKGQS